MIKETEGFEGIDGLDLSSLFNKDTSTPSNGTNASISSIPMEEEIDEDGVNNADDNDIPAPIDNQPAAPKKGAIGEEEEEEDTEEGSEEDTEADDDSAEASEEENPYTIFAKLLKENGVLSEVPDDLEGSDEAISTLVSKEIDSKVNAWIADLPEEVKFIVENYKEGVDYSKLIQKQAAIESYKSITPDVLEENDGLQEAVVLDYLIKNGWSEDEAKDEVKEYKDASLLESKSKKYVKKLVEFEETEKRAIAAQERDAAKQREENYKQHIKQLESSIKSREEIIPGVKLSDTERKQLFEGITKFDSKGENAIMKFRKENPDFDLTMAYVATVLKGDFSKISKVATTQATRKLAKTIDNAGKSTTKKSSLSLEIIKKALKH